MYSHAQHQEALVHSQKYPPIRSFTGREDQITHVEPEDLHTQTHRHTSLLTGICVLSNRAPYVHDRMKHWTRDYKLALTSDL